MFRILNIVQSLSALHKFIQINLIQNPKLAALSSSCTAHNQSHEIKLKQVLFEMIILEADILMNSFTLGSN